MAPINCIIIDSDPIASSVIQSLVKKTDFLRLEAVCSTPLEVSQCLRNKPIKIIFLNIEMPEMAHLELLEAMEKKPEIILTGSKKDYAQDTLGKGAADCLIKPIGSYPRFLKVVNRAMKRIKNHRQNASLQRYNNLHHLFVRADSLLHNLNLSDILWIQAYGDFVKVKTTSKTYTIQGKLKTLLEKLPASDFVQIHRSYIVRLDKVKNIDQSNLQVDNKILPISKSFKKQLMSRINIV